MIRNSVEMLIAAGLCAASVAACSDAIKEPVKMGGTGGGTAAGGSSSSAGGGTSMGGDTGAGGGAGAAAITIDDSKCMAACCPTDAKCYAPNATGAKDGPGAACLATHDNTGQEHIQMRQSWIRATSPAGNVGGIVYAVLSGRTELPLNGAMGTPDCKAVGPIGFGGYMQLTDMYLKKGATNFDADYAYTGFSKYVPQTEVLADLDDATGGFCFGTETYNGDAQQAPYKLAAKDMSPTDGWPTGLPAPMPLADAAWKVAPTKGKRLDKDFDLKNDRADLIQKLSTTGTYGMAGYGGVFYYNATTGYTHSYGPLGWVVVYGPDGTTHIVIPIRETEIKSTFDDPAHPNCMGQYGLDSAVTPSVGCKNGTDDKHSPWGGGNCTGSTGKQTCAPGEGPYTTNGYFLITELQQVYSSDLSVTLCVSYPTQQVVTDQGFYDMPTKGCITSKWDPKKADNAGLPKGDWCAATNSAATATCHDAWLSKSFHTFAGAKIKVDSSNNPVTCAL